VGLLTSVCCTAAMADEGSGASVRTALEDRPVAVIEELRQNLQVNLRADLLAAMPLQMDEVADVVKANTPPNEPLPEWELAGQVR
jgi:hypothetical protein